MFCRSLFVLLTMVLSVFLRYTDSDYPFGIFWPLCCLSFCDLRILITHLVSFDHCIVCLSVIYGFWLPFWYLLVIVLSVFLRFTDSDYPFGISWPLLFLSFYDLQILITLLVSSNSSYSINLKLFPRKNINFIYSCHDIDDNNSMTFWCYSISTLYWSHIFIYPIWQ